MSTVPQGLNARPTTGRKRAASAALKAKCHRTGTALSTDGFRSFCGITPTC